MGTRQQFISKFGTWAKGIDDLSMHIVSMQIQHDQTAELTNQLSRAIVLKEELYKLINDVANTDPMLRG